jgi:hypothetical protein
MVFEIDPNRCLSWPVRRPRLWFCHWPLQRLGVLSSRGADEVATRVANICAGAAIHVTLDELLLPDSSEHIHSVLTALAKLPPKRPTPASKRCRIDLQWVKHHEAYAAARGTNWLARRGPPPDLLDIHPGIKEVSDRELDILVSMGLRFPTPHPCSVELHSSISRVSIQFQRTDCITPKTRRWLGHKARLVRGSESLLFQGIHYGARNHLVHTFGDKFLHDVSGNAFEARSNTADRRNLPTCLIFRISFDAAPPRAKTRRERRMLLGMMRSAAFLFTGFASCARKNDRVG